MYSQFLKLGDIVHENFLEICEVHFFPDPREQERQRIVRNRNLNHAQQHRANCTQLLLTEIYIQGIVRKINRKIDTNEPYNEPLYEDTFSKNRKKTKIIRSR